MDFEEVDERLMTLMMAALDDELLATEQVELNALLLTNPAMAAEWDMMLRIDGLFKETPLLMPASDFAQRTVAQLPNHRARLWALGLIFLSLFVGGILPVLGMLWLGGVYGPALSQPIILDGLGQSFAAVLDMLGLIWGGLWQLLLALGQASTQTPTIWGSVLMMVGVILLWSGVYGQLIQRPQPVFVTR